MAAVHLDEAEWLTCDAPHLMLDFLQGRTAARKVWLFALACSRRAALKPHDTATPDLIALAEQFVEGRAGESGLHQALAAARCHHPLVGTSRCGISGTRPSPSPA